MGIRQSTVETAVNFGEYMLANSLTVLQATDPERENRPRCAYVSDRTGFCYMLILREYQRELYAELVAAGCVTGKRKPIEIAAVEFGRYLLSSGLTVHAATNSASNPRPPCARISKHTGYNYMRILWKHKPDLYSNLVAAGCVKGVQSSGTVKQ